MSRITVVATLILSLALAGSALAQDKVSPCYDKPDGEATKACLVQVLADQPEIKIVVPECPAGSTGEPDAVCVEKTKVYQKILADVTGQPCAGLEGERLQLCKDDQAAQSKKKTLEKHEGTKMERVSEDE